MSKANPVESAASASELSAESLPPFLMIAGMDVEPDHEEIFNEVYETEHIPNLSTVPGVEFVARYSGRSLEMAIGGRKQTLSDGSEPRYYVVYGLTDPATLTSEDWAAAVEAGRWPAEVRPHTKNRRHILLEKMPEQ